MTIIRDAKPEDVKALQEVFYTTWLTTYPNKEVGILEEDIHEKFKDVFTEEKLSEAAERIKNISNNSKYFVAELDGKIVGICRIFVREEYNQLQAIYVLPEYQQQGIGKMLWKKSLEFFDKHKKSIVQVATYNLKAIEFYKGLGFVDTGKRFSDERFRMPLSKVLIPEMEMKLESDQQVVA